MSRRHAGPRRSDPGAADRPRRRRLGRLVDAWQAERREQADEARRVRAMRSLKVRVREGVALSGLDVTDRGVAGGRPMVWLAPTGTPPVPLVDTGFRPGDPVTVRAQDPTGAADAGPSELAGTLARVRRDRVAVVLDRADRGADALEEWGPLALERAWPEATFARGLEGLRWAREAAVDTEAGRLVDALFGDQAPRPDADGLRAALDEAPLDAALNPPQREAAARALVAAPVALIHGPPGTGKTRTLVEVVRRAVARGERVLVTAASHAAVDHLVHGLVDAGLEAVRVGHPARVDPDLEAHLLDIRVEAHPDAANARRWLKEAAAMRRKAAHRAGRGASWREAREARREAFGEARRLERDARRTLAQTARRLLEAAPVVASTAAGAGGSTLEGLAFDRLVVDEATQCPDPVLCVALAKAPRAVLAGDPHQLGPTVVAREAAELGLERTAFARLASTHARAAAEGEPDPPWLRMLEVQHRMPAVLQDFASEQHYAGRLRPSEAASRQHPGDASLGAAEDPLRPGALVLVDTAGRGFRERTSDESPSRSNPEQADRTAREVRRVLSRGVAPDRVAVITPYRAHVRLLREALADSVAAGLEVDSVDAFQGREKDVVVVDLVRSNEDGELGFLSDVRRMNVALTRARRLLLVVADTATLGAHPYYGAFFDHVDAAGSWVSAWTDEAPTLGG